MHVNGLDFLLPLSIRNISVAKFYLKKIEKKRHKFITKAKSKEEIMNQGKEDWKTRLPF